MKLILNSEYTVPSVSQVHRTDKRLVDKLAEGNSPFPRASLIFTLN